MIKKYRKKPIVIEAIEITGPEVFPEIEKWMDNATLKYPTLQLFEKVKVKETSKGEYNCYLTSSNNCIFRNSFEIGDFIVKGVDGSIYPVSKESFWKVYEEENSKELTW